MWNKTEWCIFLISFTLLAFFTKTEVLSANDGSRLDAVQAIVEHFTFQINGTSFDTIDKILINGKFYSDKPPVSYLVGVPIYFLLYATGINFKNNPKLCYYLVTLLTIGISTSMMLVYFFRLLAQHKLTRYQKIIHVIALGFGTLIFPYSTVFNNHTLCAALLVIAFYFTFFAKKYCIAGLMAGLASSIDMVPGSIFLLLFCIMLLLRVKSKIWSFLVCAAMPVFLHLLLNFLISGSIIPLTLRPEFWDYPGSTVQYIASGNFVQQWNKIVDRIFELTLGKNGFFLYTPLMFLSLAGIILSIYKNKFRDEALLIGVGTFLSFLFFVITTYSDGWTYGFRYSIALIPLIYFFTPTLFKLKTIPLPLLWAIFSLVLVVSTFFSFVGVINPWTSSDKVLPNETIPQILKQIIHSPVICKIQSCFFVIHNIIFKKNSFFCRVTDVRVSLYQ